MDTSFLGLPFLGLSVICLIVSFIMYLAKNPDAGYWATIAGVLAILALRGG